MEITVKTIKEGEFKVEVAKTDTIGSLKAKIKQSHGHDVHTQKIIYSGKILADDSTMELSKITEKGFVVLMVSQPRSSKPANTSPTSTTPVPAASEPAAVAPIGESAAPPTVTSAAQTFFPENSFLSGEALQETINSMIEMGFANEQIHRALRASYNNPDRAVEYLMNGIPAHLEREASGQTNQTSAQNIGANPNTTPAPPPATSTPPSNPNQHQNLFQLAQQQQQQRQVGSEGGGGGIGAGGTDIALEELRNHPAIIQLREQVNSNPDNIQHVIQQLAMANPRLTQSLARNPEFFMQLLGVDISDGEYGDAPPGVVHVTPEENAAIGRLEALGFPRQAVIQAYLASDRNEEVAANMLFDGILDDHPDSSSQGNPQ